MNATRPARDASLDSLALSHKLRSTLSHQAPFALSPPPFALSLSKGAATRAVPSLTLLPSILRQAQDERKGMPLLAAHPPL